MSTTVWHGVTIQEQPVQFERGQQGYTLTRKWQGQYNPIQAQYYTMLSAGFKCSVSNIGGPVWELVATGIIEIDLRYEILYEKSAKGLLDSRLDIVKTLTAANKKIMNTVYNEPNKYLLTAPPFTGTAGEINQALKVYSLWASGVKSVVEFFPTMKLSYLCNNTYQVFNNMARNGSILKTSTLIAQTGAPANSIVPLLPMDGPYENFIGSYPGTLIVPLYYGWMQLGPTVEQTAIAKITVAQEWNYGLWPSWMYGLPI